MRKSILFFLIIFFGIKLGFAQIVWEDARGIAPINNFSIAINNNGDILAGRDTGSIVYSNNNGINWSYRNITDSTGRVNHLKFAPNGYLYAACDPLTPTDNRNLYKSVDTGKTWVSLPFFSHVILDFEVDPAGVLYTLIDSTYYDKVLYTSLDNGNNWTLINVPSNFQSRKISLTGIGEIFLSSFNTNTFSFDNGLTWNSDPAAPFSTVVKDPLSGKYYYTYMPNVGSPYKYNEVTQWLPSLVQGLGFNAPLSNPATDILIAPNGDKVLLSNYSFSSSYNFCYQLADSSNWVSYSEAMVPYCCAYNPVTNFMFISKRPADGSFGQMPASIYPWDIHTLGSPSGNCGEFIYSNNVYAAFGTNDIYTRTNDNFFCSSNNGSSWKKLAEINGVPPGYYLYEFRSNPYSGDNFIFAESPGSVSYLYRKLYHSDLWEMIYTDSIISNLTFTPSGKIFSVRPFNSKLSFSSDNGITWTSLYTLPLWGPGQINSLGFTTTSAGTILITYVSAGYSYALRSTDEGLTWSTSGLYANKYFRDPSGTAIYAFGYPLGINDPDGIYKSTDDGITWTQVTPATTFSTGNYVLKDMVINSCGNMYVTTSTGLYSSFDYGTTWALENSYSAPTYLVTNETGYLFTAGYYVLRSSVPLSSVDSCNLVWPGDSDNDLQVNNQDLLQVGLYYGNTGNPRATVSNNWQGFDSNDWGRLQYNGQDIKSVDCNGDGIVNSSDTLAIVQNYSFVHPRSGGSDIYSLSDPTLYFKTNGNTFAPGQIINVEIWAGTSINPVTELYGLSFGIETDQSLLIPTSSQIVYPSGFLGIPSSLVSLSHSGGISIDGAVCRTNHTDTTGFGRIGVLRFRSDSTISSMTDIILKFNNCKGIDANGNAFVFQQESDTLHINPALIGINQLTNNNAIAVYPNPASEKVNIVYDLSEVSDLKIEVTDSYGRKIEEYILKTQTSGEHTYQLDISKQIYKKGIYLVNIYLEGLHSVKRIVKM